MPRIYKRKATSRCYNSTSAETLQLALQDYKAGLSQRDTCKKYGITRSTFQNKLKNIDQTGIPSGRKPGGQTVLSDVEEDIIVQHLLVLSDWGFPFDTMDLRMTVKRYLDQEGRQESKFTNNFPGDDWVYSFMRRHNKSIKNRLCQNITKNRASISKNTLEQYFCHLQSSIIDVPPENIINYDETNLTDDPGRKKLIFKRGIRYPERMMNSSKTSTSIMMAETASGKLLPPYIVYKAEHMRTTWTEGGGPKKARYNRSKSGWFDNFCFLDWFQSIALPYCKSLPATEKKILIGDNLSSHFSEDVLQQCKMNNISFICLPPSSTHLCQPLDVAFFGPMKAKWKKLLTQFKTSQSKSNQTVAKERFPKLLRQLLDELDTTSENLKAGFLKCGIYPFDASPVLARLPDERPINDISTSISDSFHKELKRLRHGDENVPAKRQRRSKLNVVPGKSVTGPESDKDENRPGPSGTIHVPVQTEFLPEDVAQDLSEDEYLLSDTSSESEGSTQPKISSNQRNIFDDISVN